MAAPWDKIKAEWLKGGITQEELAKKYGLSVKTVSNRASKEGWKAAKGRIREKTEENIEARVVRARVTHLEKLIAAQENILDALVKMAEEVKNNPKLLLDKTGGMRNAESLTRAMQTAAMTQRDLYRLPNIDQKFAAKKWREQQKLERELKAQKEQQETETQMWTIVVPEGSEAIDE